MHLQHYKKNYFKLFLIHALVSYLRIEEICNSIYQAVCNKFIEHSLSALKLRKMYLEHA